MREPQESSAEAGGPALDAMLGTRDAEDAWEQAVVRARLREKMFAKADEPTRVGRFSLLERLGSGGIGIVYRAYDPKLKREVAVKLLRAEAATAGGTRGRERLLREAQTMARLSHPNIVAVFDVGEHDDAVFIAMEIIEGQTLGQWLAEGRSNREILEIFVAAGRGLAAAHEAGVVHRDFKPANVLVGRDGRPRVLDFGLARDRVATTSGPQPRAVGEDPLTPSALTHTGALLGTPAYMSPEQFEGRTVDARSDQFSFCVALWEALTGERPFPGESITALSQAVLAGKLREPARRLPSRVPAAFRRGLARDPADRFPDLTALLDTIVPRRRTPWALSLGLLGAGGAVVGAALWLGRSEPEPPCANIEDELEGVWDPASRAELEVLVRGNGREDPDTQWQRVKTNVDAWTKSWIAASRENCEATEVAHTQPIETMRTRASCLDARLQNLRALIGGLRNDARVLPWAAPLTRTLPRVESCTATKSAEIWPPLPDDPVAREHVRTLRQKVALMRMMWAFSPEFRDEIATEIAEAIESTHDGPLRAQFLYAGAHGLTDDRSVPMLEQAFWEAERAGDDRTAALAAATAVIPLARLQRRDDAERLGDIALAKVDRLGHDPELTTRVTNRLAHLPVRLEDRIAMFEEAVELAVRGLGEDHPYAFSPMFNLSIRYLEANRIEEARELAHQCLSAAQASVGHPSFATRQCAGALAQAQMTDNCTTALSTIEKWGPAPLGVITAAEADFAWLAHACGDPRRVDALAARLDGTSDFPPSHLLSMTYHLYMRRDERVSDWLQATPDSEPMAIVIRGGLAARAGERNTAEQEILVQLERGFGHTGASDARWRSAWTAYIRWELGDADGALAAAEDSRLYASKEGPGSIPPVARVEFEALVGILRVETGDLVGAMDPLRRALGRVRALGEHAEMLWFVPDIRFALARALWPDPSRRDEALALARRAIELYERLGPGFDEHRRTVQAWLAKHA